MEKVSGKFPLIGVYMLKSKINMAKIRIVLPGNCVKFKFELL